MLLLLPCVAYTQPKPARLIIRGDDMGYTHSGNLALIKCYKEGIEKSIEVIVPSPWFPEAVKMLNANPGVDVGIHLALSSEWDNVKWRPLTNCPSLRDSNGYFFPMIYPNKDYPQQAMLENNWKIADIEAEFRAQIEMALKHISRISHVSAHMACARVNDEVKALTKRLAIEYKIDIDPEDYGVKWLGFDKPNKTSAERLQTFLDLLNTLEPGKTYMYLEHPGLNDAELQAVHHIGYEDVAVHRQGITDMFISNKVKAFIKKKNIQLISYKDLLNK